MFIAETAIMAFVMSMERISTNPFLHGILGSLVLVILSLIPLYCLVTKPLEIEIQERLKLEKTKDFLTHSIIHDLRNPLNVLMLYLHRLEKGIEGRLPDQLQDKIRLAFSKGAEMSNLISDILDINSMQEDRLRIKLEKTDLRQLLQDDVSLLNDLARSQSKEIISSFPADIPPLLTDRDMLKRVVFNLLTNAIKFSPHGGKIRLGTEKKDSRLTVSVDSQGLSISEDDQKKIFETQRPTDSQEQRGYGIGLRFSKMAVEALGGKIGVKSVQGEGNTFYFTIPIRPEANT